MSEKVTEISSSKNSPAGGSVNTTEKDKSAPKKESEQAALQDINDELAALFEEYSKRGGDITAITVNEPILGSIHLIVFPATRDEQGNYSLMPIRK